MHAKLSLVVAFSSLLPLAAPAAAPLRPVAPHSPAAPGALAAADDTITIAAKPDGVDVTDLIAQAQKAAGEPFLFDARDVEKVRVVIAGSIAVESGRFLEVFERLLGSVDLVHLEQRSGGTTFHLVRRLGQQARGLAELKSLAPILPAQEVKERYAQRHALVTTWYRCSKLPAREAVTTLNLWFSDSATQAIRNIEGTDDIVMTGFSDQIARQLAMLDAMQAAEAADPRSARIEALAARLGAVEAELARIREGAVPKAK